MDVGDDSASGDGGLDKGVKLFVSADGELKMPTRVVRGAAKLVRSGRRSGSRRGARGESRRSQRRPPSPKRSERAVHQQKITVQLHKSKKLKFYDEKKQSSPGGNTLHLKILASISGKL